MAQAGADPHVDDPLGGWLTTDQLARRDRRCSTGCAGWECRLRGINPDTGTYRLGENPKAWQPRPGGRDLVLLLRAIRLEEYLYVSFTTESGRQKRIHALPGRVKKVGGRRCVILRERSGECCLVNLDTIREVAEAFGMNR